MSDIPASNQIENWLNDVRQYIAANASELLPTLDVYAGEARFGRSYIAPDLHRLSPSANILEVGAGSLLLSCQLVLEGFQVTALEPIGCGFSHFALLQKLVLELATIRSCRPRLLDQGAEALTEQGRFDYAFSVNVMEHVADVARTISNVGTSLKLGAIYRFTCPNYLFPYEPHFNSPTLFTKKLTERFLGKRLFADPNLSDPQGTWASLNWISVLQIRRAIRRRPELQVHFNTDMLASTFVRVAVDSNFGARRSKWMRAGIQALVRLKIHRLTQFIPAVAQPIIDCCITRTKMIEIKGKA
jgi:2-polyprenyl-3-methyl-5-hydroxy-6-metoxy-1,4-benzoquinol methylase